MDKFVTTFIILAILNLVGCSSVQTRNTVATSTAARAVPVQFVSTLIYRQNPAQVPVPVTGLSLRATLADARDLASRGGAIISAFALNDIIGATVDPEINSELAPALAGSTVEDVKANPIFAGEEVVLLVRGGIKFFIPSMMINDTAAGNIRVGGGDIIATLPLNVLKGLSNQGEQSLTVSNVGTFTLLGSFFDELQLPITKDGNKVKRVMDLRQRSWTAAGWGTPPDLDSNFDARGDLLPNTIVLTRASSAGGPEVFILPCQMRSQGSQLYDTFNNVDADGFPKFGELMLLDGDIVEITRLERVPIIAAGLLAPVIPRIPTTESPSVPRHCSKPLQRMLPYR